MVQEEMPFKDSSYLELWHPFCSPEQNHLCNFGRGYQEEWLGEIILNLDQWLRRRCLLKIFLIWSSGGPCSRAEPFMQFWERVLWGTILWNYFEFGLVVHEEMPFKNIFIWSSDHPFVQRSRTIYTILVEGRNNSVFGPAFFSNFS